MRCAALTRNSWNNISWKTLCQVSLPTFNRKRNNFIYKGNTFASEYNLIFQNVSVEYVSDIFHFHNKTSFHTWLHLSFPPLFPDGRHFVLSFGHHSSNEEDLTSLPGPSRSSWEMEDKEEATCAANYEVFSVFFHSAPTSKPWMKTLVGSCADVPNHA